MVAVVITWLAALAGGGALGSFLSLACARFSPALSPAQWFAAMCFPASRSDCCQRRLLWRDTLPLMSWPALRGRCRVCQQPFDAGSFLTEWLFALLCLLLLQSVDSHAERLYLIAAASLLFLLAAIDRRHYFLPDPLNYLLLWLGLLHAALTGRETAAIYGAVAGYCSLWLLAWGYRRVRDVEGLGYGDFKLFAALGACCGWQALPGIALGATLLALAAMMSALWRGLRPGDSPLPFGPFLAIAGWVTLVLQTRFTLL